MRGDATWRTPYQLGGPNEGDSWMRSHNSPCGAANREAELVGRLVRPVVIGIRVVSPLLGVLQAGTRPIHHLSHMSTAAAGVGGATAGPPPGSRVSSLVVIKPTDR